MFDSQNDIAKANRTPALIWAILGGAVPFGILAQFKINALVPLIVGIIVGWLIYRWRRNR
jgi:hypothetical protein